jgi:hypothetical protein
MLQVVARDQVLLLSDKSDNLRAVLRPDIPSLWLHIQRTLLTPRHMASMSSLPSGLLPALVSATMDVYRHVTATLLPVPSRPHYLFSIRHVGAVFKVRLGMSQLA